MLRTIYNNKLLLIAIHIAIGFLMTVPGFSKAFGIGILSFGLFYLFKTENENEEAFLLSSYMIGAEVLVRMSKGFVFYETGKYGVILFLLLGLFLKKTGQRISVTFVFYLLVLLLGIIFSQVPEGESVRKAIIFNLSGPVLLGVSGVYFYKRVITKEQVINALYSMLLPIFSIVTYLYFKAPDMREILFTGGANFELSGGFGPNQVATIIGLGIFIIGAFILLKERLTGTIFLDALFLIYFVYRGLLTFSRGGIITGVFVFVCFSFFYTISQKRSLQLFFKYVLIGCVFSLAVWTYTSEATGGMLDNRYAGKNARGVQKEDISSGRIAIFTEQFKSFFNHPLGIGVGNGKYKRELEGEVTAASHNEIGRLIEEHGLLGFGMLLFLIVLPLVNFYNVDNYQRAFLVSFWLLWFLTINHSAMRIALPGFIYGLSLITITKDET